MLVTVQFGVCTPLVVWLATTHTSHHTPQNNVDLKYLLPPHTLIALYSCIKGTALTFHRDADNEINEYLIDPGDWKTLSINGHLGRGYKIVLLSPDLTLICHIKVWLTQKTLKYFMNPNPYLRPLAQVWIWQQSQIYLGVQYTWEDNFCTLLYFLLGNVFILDEWMHRSLN